LLGLWIIAAADAVPNDQRYAEAVVLLECGFEEDWDHNFDGWPDRWTRRRGAGFPQYLEIKTSEEPAASGKRCLRMQLDGGAATVHSPAVQIATEYSYVLEAKIKTEGLKHDQAYCSITFYDENRRPLKTVYSERFTQLDGWQKVRIGPIIPDHEEAQLAVVGLHLSPTDNGVDLRGAALFDDIWMARLPRMTLYTNSKHNVFTRLAAAEITCNLSGIADPNPKLTFELFDVWNQPVDRHEQRLAGKAMREMKSKSSFLLKETTPESPGYVGQASWRPQPKDFGYYRLAVRVEGGKGLIHQRTVSLAFVPPGDPPAGGEFGWTLPRGDDPLELGDLSQLLGMVGVNWVKFPVWYTERESQKVDRLVWFAERLSFQNIELVGMLHQPPANIREHFGDGTSPTAAAIFSTESELWYPSLETVLTRLSLKIRWWQLGHDQDISFVGYPGLEKKLRQVKQRLERFGQEVNLGIGWRWVNELPTAENPPWEFFTMSAEPPLTDQELARYLADGAKPHGRRWVVIDPLPRDGYTLTARAADLVHRMMAAKINKADAIFIPDPFDPRHGLMTTDGMPGELLVPWRTTATALAASQYVGSITMPGGSHNHTFTKGGEALMVVWADQPAAETIYLGEDVRHVDIWGRRLPVGEQGHRQVIQVGTTPTFLMHVSEPVARWRMAFEFARTKIPSVFGRPHANAYRLTNYFPQGAGGTITLETPSVWKTEPRTGRFNMAAGEKRSGPFTITLPYDASSGEHDVRVDFDINVDRRYQFSVYRSIEVGMGDVVFEVGARLNEKDELEISQVLVNYTARPVRFKCNLFIPGQRRRQTLVQQLGLGRDRQMYRIPDGRQVMDKDIWIQATEIGGPRILNYRVVVDPASSAVAAP